MNFHTKENYVSSRGVIYTCSRYFFFFHKSHVTHLKIGLFNSRILFSKRCTSSLVEPTHNVGEKRGFNFADVFTSFRVFLHCNASLETSADGSSDIDNFGEQSKS